MRYGKLLTYLFLSLTFAVFSWKVYTDDEVPPVQLSEEGIYGKVLWQKHNCIACHQLYGLGGFMGPDLTNVMSDPAKGEIYVNAILKHGMNRMPDYNFTGEEIKALAGFLKHADESGVYPLRNFTLNIDGTVTDPKR